MEITKTKEIIYALRAGMIDEINRVVQLHGVIGTFFKNIGTHHTEAGIGDEYGDLLIVPIQNPAYTGDPGGISGNLVNDLYIDPSDNKLYATLEMESSVSFDEPIDNIQLEGLVGILVWLTNNGFRQDDAVTDTLPNKDDLLRIANRWWYSADTDDLGTITGISPHSFDEIVEYIEACDLAWEKLFPDDKISKYNHFKHP